MIDSNILVYAHDSVDLHKHTKANELLERLEAEGQLNVSVQTLHEFYVRATKPNRSPALSPAEAKAVVDDFFAVATVYPLSPDVSRRAFSAVSKYKMSLWDALIWAVAKEYGDSVVYTEDIQSQPEIEGVRYINPLM